MKKKFCPFLELGLALAPKIILGLFRFSKGKAEIFSKS